MYKLRSLSTRPLSMFNPRTFYRTYLPPYIFISLNLSLSLSSPRARAPLFLPRLASTPAARRSPRRFINSPSPSVSRESLCSPSPRYFWDTGIFSPSLALAPSPLDARLRSAIYTRRVCVARAREKSRETTRGGEGLFAIARESHC